MRIPLDARTAACAWLVATSLLAGCAVMSKDDCLKADWRDLGRRDALQGLTLARFTQRAEACRKNDIGADRVAYAAGHAEGQRSYCSADRGQGDASVGQVPAELCAAPVGQPYQSGYAQGLQKFCTPRSGYEFGRLGGTYRNTCPADLAVGFEVGLRRGNELRELNTRLDTILRDSTEQRRLLADDKATPDQREAASRRLRQLESDEAFTRRLIRQAEVSALTL